MALSYITYPGDGSTKDFTFPFMYIDAGDIAVYVGATKVTFTLTNASAVKTTVAPASGTVVRIRRLTSKTSVPVNFSDGSNLLQRDLDLLGTWTLYQAQEAADVSADLGIIAGQPLDTSIAAAVQANVSAAQALSSSAASAASATSSSTSAGSSSTSAASAASSLVSLTAATGAALVGWTSPGAGAVARTVSAKLNDGEVSVFDFMTAAQIADVQAGSATLDVTAAINAAIAYAWPTGKTIAFPGGIYLTTGIVIAPTAAQRGRTLHLRGAGFGEPFVTPSGSVGTSFRRTTDGPVIRVVQPAVTQSAGTLDISGIYFSGNSSVTPVVHIEALYGVCEFHHNAVYQAGVGDGMWVDYCATSQIHDNYIMNKDQFSSGLGASRIAVGIHMRNNIDSGLQRLIGNTSRGWKTAFKIGIGGTSAYMYGAVMDSNECSVTYNGIVLTDNCRAASITRNYLEGGEGGIGIDNLGNYNSITNNFSFAEYSVHIRAEAFTYGDVIRENHLSAGSLPNQTLISVTSDSVFGGPGKTVSDNHLTYGGGAGTAGVIGLKMAGYDPRISHQGNSYNPRGVWVGGAGTAKLNLTGAIASDGTAGNGIYGVGMVQSKNSAVEVPHFGRGAINLAVEGTSLTNADVASGAMNLGSLSVFTLAMTSAVTLTQFNAPNLPDKTFSIRITNNLTTLQQGPLIKLIGSVNFTPGANGSWHSFQVAPGGICWETARAAY